MLSTSLVVTVSSSSWTSMSPPSLRKLLWDATICWLASAAIWVPTAVKDGPLFPPPPIPGIQVKGVHDARTNALLTASAAIVALFMDHLAWSYCCRFSLFAHPNGKAASKSAHTDGH